MPTQLLMTYSLSPTRRRPKLLKNEKKSINIAKISIKNFGNPISRLIKHLKVIGTRKGLEKFVKFFSSIFLKGFSHHLTFTCGINAENIGGMKILSSLEVLSFFFVAIVEEFSSVSGPIQFLCVCYCSRKLKLIFSHEKIGKILIRSSKTSCK
jgi:hypothetical protein